MNPSAYICDNAPWSAHVVVRMHYATVLACTLCAVVAAAGVPRERGLVFAHVRKTGGTTVRSILFEDAQARHLPFTVTDVASEFAASGIDTLARHGYVYGHVDYAHMAHDRMSDVDIVTLVREPLDRFVSWCFWINRPVSRNMSLAAFRSVFAAFKAGYANTYCATIGDVAVLERRFALVGTTDMFDAFVTLLRLDYDVRNVSYVRHRVVLGRPRVNRAISPDHERVFWSDPDMQCDRRVYEWAHARMEERIRAMPLAVRRELARFRADERAIHARTPCKRFKVGVVPLEHVRGRRYAGCLPLHRAPG